MNQLPTDAGTALRAEIAQEARTQTDELSVLGTGVVQLPSRG